MHYALELRSCGLDLTTGVLRLLQCLVGVCLLKVIVSSQNCLALLAEVCALEHSAVLDCFVVLVLPFLQVSIVEAGWVIYDRWLVFDVTSRRLDVTQSAHQAQIVELADIFRGQRCNGAVMS